MKLKIPKNRKIFPLSGFGILLIGIAVIYMMERSSGNIVTSADNGQCSLKATAAKLLDAAARGSVAAMRSAEIPQSVQDLAFTGPDGIKKTLADFKGKTVLVNLWSTWCVPCREEIPALDKLQASESGSDFQVVAINIDIGDDTKSKAFLDEIGAHTLPFYRDTAMSAFKELKRKNLIFGMPMTMIVDRDGCEIAVMHGPADWASEDAKMFIATAREMNTNRSIRFSAPKTVTQ